MGTHKRGCSRIPLTPDCNLLASACEGLLVAHDQVGPPLLAVLSWYCGGWGQRVFVRLRSCSVHMGQQRIPSLT